MNQELEELTAKFIIAGLIIICFLVGTSFYFIGLEVGYQSGHGEGYIAGYSSGLDNNYVKSAAEKISQKESPRSIAGKIFEIRQEASIQKSIDDLVSGASKLFFNNK